MSPTKDTAISRRAHLADARADAGGGAASAARGNIGSPERSERAIADRIGPSLPKEGAALAAAEGQRPSAEVPNRLSILWRGPLESCNYDCSYCPFGKATATRAELAADAAALARFVAWAEAFGQPLSVFFTPWGEGLIHRHYQEAIAHLSRLDHVGQVAIQTNLSARLDFLSAARAARVGLWSTYHPDWARRDRFVAQVSAARAAGAVVSAGVVGMPQYIEEIEALRAELPPDVYLWVNAVRGQLYPDDLASRITAVDPLFPINLRRPYPSAGRPCRAGETVLSVDGDGNAKRCHFLPEILGNIYDPGFAAFLRPRLCPAPTCNCHVGYVHMPERKLYEIFGDNVLSRAWDGWAAGAPAEI